MATQKYFLCLLREYKEASFINMVVFFVVTRVMLV